MKKFTSAHPIAPAALPSHLVMSLTTLLSLGRQTADQLPQGEEHAKHQLALLVNGILFRRALRRLSELLLTDRGCLRVCFGEQGLAPAIEYVQAVDGHGW